MLGLGLHLGTAAQVLLHLDGEDGGGGLRALVQLLQQLPTLPEVRQLLLEGGAAAAAAAAAGVRRRAAAVVVVSGGGGVAVLRCLGRVIDIKALVLEELDDGELGQVQLGGERVDGLFVGVKAHVLDEALQDAQSLQGDLPPAAGLDAAAALVLRLGRGGGGWLSRRQSGAGVVLLLQGLLGEKRLGGVERQRGLVLLLRLRQLSLEREKPEESRN